MWYSSTLNLIIQSIYFPTFETMGILSALLGNAVSVSQPDKILFFTDTHFLFFKSHHTNGTLPFARHTSQRFAKVKEPFLAHPHEEIKFTYNIL